jgi:hypothetical protein
LQKQKIFTIPLGNWLFFYVLPRCPEFSDLKYARIKHKTTRKMVFLCPPTSARHLRSLDIWVRMFGEQGKSDFICPKLQICNKMLVSNKLEITLRVWGSNSPRVKTQKIFGN